MFAPLSRYSGRGRGGRCTASVLLPSPGTPGEGSGVRARGRAAQRDCRGLAPAGGNLRRIAERSHLRPVLTGHRRRRPRLENGLSVFQRCLRFHRAALRAAGRQGTRLLLPAEGWQGGTAEGIGSRGGAHRLLRGVAQCRPAFPGLAGAPPGGQGTRLAQTVGLRRPKVKTGVGRPGRSKEDGTSFRADGRQLAVSHLDGTLTVYDAETGRSRAELARRGRSVDRGVPPPAAAACRCLRCRGSVL